MPIYEYQCAACGHHLEALQKMSEEPLKECPQCHQAELQKMVSAAGFQLKGSGWYITDYKKDKNKSTSSSDSASTNTESKPKDSSGGSNSSNNSAVS